MNYSFFATCPKNIEDLLASELESFGAESVKPAVSGVSFTGSITTAYKACLWSRIANRILLRLDSFEASSKEELYAGIYKIKWEDHFTIDRTFVVDCNLIHSDIIHSHYAALIVKDAIADHFRNKFKKRPSVDTENPDIKFNLFLNRNEAVIYLDFSGKSLHIREYRVQAGKATLKENVAAAILLRAGWQELSASRCPFIDPMCGTGTFSIEAALIACNIAPGLTRKWFGFNKWDQHQPKIWEKLVKEAEEQKETGIKNIPHIFGYDNDKWAVNAAFENIEKAGLKGLIHIEKKELEDIEPPSKKYKPGLIVMNPPYGHRLGADENLTALYENMGKVLFNNFPGWHVSVLTGSVELSKSIGLRAKKTNNLYNGPIKCILSHFELTEDNIFRSADDKSIPLSKGAEMFANRLRKNQKNLKKWIKNNNISSYRIYDADMPEYAAAIDIYEKKWAVIQEYAPPPTINTFKAEERLNDIIRVVPQVLSIEKNNVYLKQRKKQKGPNQYTKLDKKNSYKKVKEEDNTFLINLSDYLDVGLFLDHRLTRKLIQKMSANKSFLNLFSYTGTATVYAAKGGATFTTSVDNSNTYTDWAEENMKLNGFSNNSHTFIKADCFKWLKKNATKYYLIFLDPPTFSNSSDMYTFFDVQKDHVDLIRLTLSSLKTGGTLIFSNNSRKFKLDTTSLEDLNIENITESTISEDFKRKKGMHHCWIIKAGK